MTTQTDNKQVTRQLLAVFEHGRLEELDKVVARVTMHGRHVGQFLGRPPTG